MWVLLRHKARGQAVNTLNGPDICLRHNAPTPHGLEFAVSFMVDDARAIRVSQHASERMQQRGATLAEVEQTIRKAPWQSAAGDKRRARHDFLFAARSPITGEVYRYKKVEVIFAETPHAIIVVTVKVFYHNGR